ncbi:MAG: DNA alkylation repair protein [Clostridia bacterium]|nr:DNA alkylation repair protein [Clostridia bacterium]
MNTEAIRDMLMDMRDEEYGKFTAKLNPNIDPETVIGVRTPELRGLAKSLRKVEDIDLFLSDLPHRYFDENQLHAFLISEGKQFDDCIQELQQFLPYVDNWATCDQLSPKVFRKHHDALMPHILSWLDSDHTYTVRFGVDMLMVHYLDEDFDPACLEWVSNLRSDEYYINMAVAWYFATALAKQWQAAVPYIEGRRLDGWTHNKAIQKAVESRRITPEQKTYLRGLKIQGRIPSPGSRR